MQWEDSNAAEKERLEDEAKGVVWLVDTTTWQVAKAEGYNLIGVGPMDGEVELAELSKCELIKRLREARNA